MFGVSLREGQTLTPVPQVDTAPSWRAGRNKASPCPETATSSSAGCRETSEHVSPVRTGESGVWVVGHAWPEESQQIASP